MSIVTTIILFLDIIIGVSLALNSRELENYIGNSKNNVLNILPGYEVERYVFSNQITNLEGQAKNIYDENNTILYRIPTGPKTLRANGKRPVFIQHGIICNNINPCVVNKPQIAVAYLLADRGYDVWLGIRNSSMADNLVPSEQVEKNKLENVAQYILHITNEPELLVMGYVNGSVKFFGIANHNSEYHKKPSYFSKWLHKIPGVNLATRWYTNIYNKGKNYLSRGFNKVISSVDTIGIKIDYIIDDNPIRDLKNTVLKAWGIAVNMVLPTFTIYDLSNMINHPDVYLDTPQLIKKYGYEVETHEIETEDGYLLSVHRIPGSKKYPAKPGKPVVFLQHGILESSANWIMNGPTKGLGYILADEGYDVWMGNSRGNTYSRAHKNLSTTDTKFWDFSYHEMGVYDLPATIDHILSVTEQEKIYYIGFSQGTTQFFIMMSEKPEYNEKIITFVGYAPAAYLGNIQPHILIFIAKFVVHIYDISKLMHINEFLPTNALLTKIGRYTCEARSVSQVICSNIVFMIVGYDIAELNITMVPIYLSHDPAGSSVKQFVHYGQAIVSKKFQKFDYYDPLINMQYYGQVTPPEYKLNNTRVPVALFHASNDLLANPKDVKLLESELPNLQLSYKVPMKLFNHIDFVLAIDAPLVVFEPTINYLKKFLHQ